MVFEEQKSQCERSSEQAVELTRSFGEASATRSLCHTGIWDFLKATGPHPRPLCRKVTGSDLCNSKSTLAPV